MATKKHKFEQGLYFTMNDEVPYSEGETLEGDSSERKPSFNDFVRHLCREKEALDALPEYGDRDSRQGLEVDKVEDFLKRHAGVTYSEFLREAHPEELEEGSYGLTNRRSIKRNIFDVRARLYLAALWDFEESGGDIESILEQIREENLPFTKESRGKEPTFEEIYKALKKYT